MVNALSVEHVEEFGQRSTRAHDAEKGQKDVPQAQETTNLESEKNPQNKELIIYGLLITCRCGALFRKESPNFQSIFIK